MSVDATRWAWSQQDLRPLHKLILLSLADRAGIDNTCWPSYEAIKADTGADRKTIWEAIKHLAAAGLLRVTDERKGVTGQVPVYQLIGVDERFRKRNGSENGMVPFLPPNGSENGMGNGSENGIRNQPLNQPEPTKKENARRAHRVAASIPLPDWIPKDAWDGWLDMRKKQRKPATERAKTLAIADLEKLRRKGHDPGAVLDQSTVRGWMGLFEIKDGGSNGQDRGYSKGRGERVADTLRELYREAVEQEGGVSEFVDGGVIRTTTG